MATRGGWKFRPCITTLFRRRPVDGGAEMVHNKKKAIVAVVEMTAEKGAERK